MFASSNKLFTPSCSYSPVSRFPLTAIYPRLNTFLFHISPVLAAHACNAIERIVTLYSVSLVLTETSLILKIRIFKTKTFLLGEFVFFSIIAEPVRFNARENHSLFSYITRTLFISKKKTHLLSVPSFRNFAYNNTTRFSIKYFFYLLLRGTRYNILYIINTTKMIIMINIVFLILFKQ